MTNIYNVIYSLKQIETPRLIIRPVQLGDEIELNQAINHSLVLLQKWQAWAKNPSIGATSDFVQRGVFGWQSGYITDFPMVMIHKQDQKIIGASGYNDRSDIYHGLYETGYWCDVDYQGHGLVTECANALTRYAFGALNASKVILSIQMNNKKSIAVAERLNFMSEGQTHRDPLSPTSKNPKGHNIYSAKNTHSLPPLKAFWQHHIDENTDAKIIAWAKKTLKVSDNKAFTSSRAVISTPWSTILEINTGKDFVYLKHTPRLLALEPAIIQFLHDQFQVNVPEVIAHNDELNCFLMKDAGKPLRQFLKQQFDVALFSKAIDQFTSIQIAAQNQVDAFFDIGVPDWRLDKLPDLYQQLISQKQLLISDGLSKNEIRQLETLPALVSKLCIKLSSYCIPPSIVQPDFSDNNLLIANTSQDITLIDLGEIVVSHPFFSLIGCLFQIKKHHALTDKDDHYQQLKNACLENYLHFKPKKSLLEAFSIASRLHFVYRALSTYRLMIACDIEKLKAVVPNRLSGILKEFITAGTTIGED
jgi:RimJ/RimL family protein N-acetyltransferase